MGKTSAEKKCAWLRFQKFLQQIEVQHDPFLDFFNDKHKITILSAFVQAPCQADFYQARFVTLVASAVRSSMDYVCSSFKDTFRGDPRLDEEGKPLRFLSK